MPITRRHVILDGLKVAALTAASFCVFMLVLAQTFQLPAQCVEKGITDPAACETYMKSLNPAVCGNAICETAKGETPAACPADCHIQLPQQCVEKGITTATECETYMKSLTAAVCGNAICEGLKGETTTSCPDDCHAPSGSGTSAAIQLPQQCVEKGITTATECETYMKSLTAAVCGNAICEGLKGETTTSCPDDCHAATAFQLPQQCVDKGITDPVACKAYMETSGTGTFQQPRPFCGNKICEIAAGESPERCATDCAATGTTPPTLPPQCVDEGIEDPAECKAFIEQHAAESQQAGAEENSGVPQLPELCRLKKVTDPAECKKIMLTAFGSVMDKSVGSFSSSAFLPKACQEAGITEPKACAELMSKGRSNADQTGFKPEFLPKECQDKKITNQKDCEKLFTDRAMPQECKDAGAATPEECKRLMVKKHLPEECRKLGIEDEATCRATLEKSFLPKSCADAGIESMDECKSFLLEKHGRPDDCDELDDTTCLRLIETGQIKDKKALAALAEDLPARCRELGAKDFASCQEAQEKKLVPQECKDAGIFSPESCKKFFFEKYQGQATDGRPVPQECKDAGKNDKESCGAYLKSRYLPKECIEAKISDPESCRKYLTSLHLPQECKDAGVEDRDACEELLRSKYMTPACASQGITDEEACKEFLYGRIASKVGCDNLTADECETTVKQRHLGAILDKTNKIEEIGDVLGEATDEGGGIDLGALATRGDDLHKRMLDAMPFKPGQERRLRALHSKANVEVTEDDTVIATAPALLAFDADGDGVPDDVEKRNGTDPEKADTDGDGDDDADELKEKELKGIDRAISDGQALGQPKDEGETDEEMTVKLRGVRVSTSDVDGDGVVDSAGQDDDNDDQGEIEDGVTLDGSGTPGDVVTVYIYSDLPLVVTTTVDDNGQWSYTLTDPLKDGSHEVYVAVNDDTGKVVRKSNPLALLVSQAQAAETTDAISAEATVDEAILNSPDANAEQGRSSESDIKVFVFAGIGLAVVALIIGAALLLGRKKNDGMTP